MDDLDQHKRLVGHRIKSFRHSSGLSQEELAKDLKITISALSQYETGKRLPRYGILMNIADYFHTTTDYLLGRTNVSFQRQDHIVEVFVDGQRSYFCQL